MFGSSKKKKAGPTGHEMNKRKQDECDHAHGACRQTRGIAFHGGGVGRPLLLPIMAARIIQSTTTTTCETLVRMLLQEWQSMILYPHVAAEEDLCLLAGSAGLLYFRRNGPDAEVVNRGPMD
jgi:hypothetical protein